ncbi:MAG TPA: cation:proton antiporter, partial [Thermoplasmata archaeon]|nr:cation:proton antiporter [Thermoplasmata archaeon]
ALLIGVATAATSAAVSASLIQSERVAGSLGAKFYINVAAMDDVVALILLSIVLTVVGGQFNVVQVARGALESVAAWLILLLAAVFIIPRVLRLPALRTSRDVPFVILFLLVALVTALGFSAVIGAYIAGLAVAESLVAARTRHLTEILLAIFGSLFFVVVGASFNIRLLADPTLLLLGGLFALLAIVGKFVGIFPFALRRLGTRRDATAVAVGMLPRGEIGLIVAALGASPAVALLDSKALGEIILMAIFTTIVGAFLFRRVVARTGWAAQAAAAAAAPPEPGVNLP